MHLHRANPSQGNRQSRTDLGWVRILLIASCLATIGFALFACGAGPDDAGLFPSAKIAQLKAEKSSLAEQLPELPPREVKAMNGFLGYHSALLPVDRSSSERERRIDFHLQRKKSQPIHTIALMPAYNPKLGTDLSYGFPKRFRIELRDDPNSEPLKVYDFTEEDYPTPAITPLILSEVNTASNMVRLVVEKGVVDDGLEYFALGEVYIITENRDGKLTNVAPYSRPSFSDGFESPPTWSQDYLVDRLSALNMTLGSRSKQETDFVSIIPVQGGEEPIEVVIDLGRAKQTGRVAFFPAKAPWEISLPHFGYPGSITVEGYSNEDFSQHPIDVREIVDSWDKTKSMILGDIFFAVPLRGRNIRYVRLLFRDLPIHDNSRIFAIGEISVFQQGTLLSHNRPVTISGLNQADADPSLLVDNYAFNQEILPPEEWLKGVAKRYELETRTAQIDLELSELEQRLGSNRNLAIGLLLIVVSGAALGLYTNSRLAHSKDLKRIRSQISSDLHDDVGSSIGALTLGLERLKNHKHSEPVTQLTQDLRLISKEAAVALREAVWLTDQNSISLHDLGKMMKERAYFILGKTGVSFEMDSELPDIDISLIHKRNILLLFKEAMHNFVKHAQAEILFISLRQDPKEELILELRDDGVGFSTSPDKRKGWGLSTMSKRATQMGGRLDITSDEGSGSCLTLRIPFKELKKR
ncbi:ATP-binding protein [Pelagicoccus mobilis]|uniref:Oxygen sensor histidine kinase NreB n=1 Tax=Pelagicoccus mobilis TaxID=415221 RepID=A0A934VPF7_9BACT|nr:ATP-binding protein [Pelagicoccus mobilis]MBK1875483.1 hypothetical protein [Pelagicoccus mobilis]